jgi:hypothetical protein
LTEQEFRNRLTQLGFNQSSFARRLIELGDPRSFTTVLRSIANYATGVTSVPGELVVVLNLMGGSAAARGASGTRGPGRPRRLASPAS